MAPRYDSGFSSLLCSEEHAIFQNQNQSSNGEFSPLPSGEFLSIMIEQEHHHIPRIDYLRRLRNFDSELMARKEALDWITKVSGYFRFGPLCSYLAINYLDRFLSAYELPKGNAWTVQLLAVACLSLAAKLEETQVPVCVDLQVAGAGAGAGFVFESRTIRRMELLVLSILKWRIQSITPFSFIDYYFHMILDDQLLLATSIVRSIQLFSITIKGIDFLEFSPSEIAAAVAISVAGETQTVDTEKAISLLTQNTQKEERVVKCIELIERMSLISNYSVLDPQSPNGVLKIGCLSEKSEETGGGWWESSTDASPDAIAKRRRLNRACEGEVSVISSSSLPFFEIIIERQSLRKTKKKIELGITRCLRIIVISTLQNDQS